MAVRRGPWPAILIFALLCAVVVATAFIFGSLWVTLPLCAVIFAMGYLLLSRILRSFDNAAILSNLVQDQPPKENAMANRLLAELLLAGSEKRLTPIVAQELLSKNLNISNFVIFFREDEKLVPRIYAGLNKNNFASPFVHRLSAELKRGSQDGAVSRAESDIRLAYKSDDVDSMTSPVAFNYSWSRSRSVFIVADDPQGDFTQMISDAEFNKIFWPGLDYSFRMNQKLMAKNIENRQMSQQLNQARKDMAELGRDLKNKIIDIQSFVKVSNELYSLFSEEQLFQTLIEIVRGQLHTPIAEILVPSGEGKFAIRQASSDELPSSSLALDCESELCELIMKSPKPILLPLAASGMKRDEPFLNKAIAAGVTAASAIKAGGKTACILLVGEKNDKSQYSGQDIDFLYAVSNIASLALDNIYQYSTIEKLSYTDSMTGIFNYRYFYKRLNEEILRSKRFERELALVILDIDNFKLFNDNYGHQAGDLILKQLSDLITRTIRSIDVVSRYGGEEFCIIMPDTGIGNCSVFIERLRCQIAESQFESNLFPRGSSITVSVGGAVFPHHASTPDRLIYGADMALLKAKSFGRNRAIMYESDTTVETHPAERGYDEDRQKTLF
jgi:diguanylate cyclase (GGDEF)-like protein